MVRVAATLAAVLLVAAGAGCDRSSGDFCGDLAGTLELQRDRSADASPEDLEAYFESVEEGLDAMAGSAPETLADEVAVLEQAFEAEADVLDDVDWRLERVDPERRGAAFATEEFAEAAAALDAYAADECDLDVPRATTSTTTSDTTVPPDGGTTTTLPADELAPTTSTPLE